MKKFYVQCGDKGLVILASTHIQASMIMVIRVLKNYDVESLPKTIRVSQRGFKHRKSDEVFSTSKIIELIYWSNNYQAE